MAVNSTTKLSLGFLLLLLGCQTQRPTAFAPISAKLEQTPYGGVRYLVFTNTSGKDLHNVSCSVYVWNNQNFLMEKRYTRRMYLRQPLIPAGQVIRVHGFADPNEEPIPEPITGVDIVGRSDEGPFREAFFKNDADELKPARGTSAP